MVQMADDRMVNLGKRLAGLGLVACAILAGCGDRELVLDGERFDVRGEDAIEARAGGGQAALYPATKLPAPRNHTSWTHRNGTPAHKITHPSLAATLSQVWSVDIGAGNTRKARITTDPIVAGGRIFTMDSASQVVATGSDGVKLWTRPLIPSSDRAADASGGGLAFGNGVLYATTGFGELFAIDATSGAVRWRQKLDAPLTSAPTVGDGLVYVVSRDNTAWAIDTKQGRIKWQLPGTPARAMIDGGAGPALAGRTVVFPFGSGELAAALKSSGLRVWGTFVAGQRRGAAYADISDVTGDPVIVGRELFAANQGGRVVALDARTGTRLWTAKQGAYSPVWPSGNSVFLISDRAQLIRLDRQTGETVWAVDLPYYKARKLRKRDEIYAHFGPILAGGRLLVASSDGMLRSYDPRSGALRSKLAIKGGAASNPVVVKNTLYVVTAKGQLVALR